MVLVWLLLFVQSISFHFSVYLFHAIDAKLVCLLLFILFFECPRNQRVVAFNLHLHCDPHTHTHQHQTITKGKLWCSRNGVGVCRGEISCNRDNNTNSFFFKTWCDRSTYRAGHLCVCTVYCVHCVWRSSDELFEFWEKKKERKNEKEKKKRKMATYSQYIRWHTAAISSFSHWQCQLNWNQLQRSTKGVWESERGRETRRNTQLMSKREREK